VFVSSETSCPRLLISQENADNLLCLVFSGFNSPGISVPHWGNMDGSCALQGRRLGSEITLEVSAPKIGPSVLQRSATLMKLHVLPEQLASLCSLGHCCDFMRRVFVGRHVLRSLLVNQ
jgi:hypothetical protein